MFMPLNWHLTLTPLLIIKLTKIYKTYKIFFKINKSKYMKIRGEQIKLTMQ